MGYEKLLILSNGLIEQCGRSTTTTVNLLIKYTNTNYVVTSSPAVDNTYNIWNSEFFRVVNESSMTRRNPNSWNCYWHTEGY